MSDDRRITERRRSTRRTEAGPTKAAGSESAASPLPVPIGEPASQPADLKPRRGGFATFAAQVLGQGGQKRGLRGGPKTLERAGASYLETEWSGPADRRSPPGRITKTDI